MEPDTHRCPVDAVLEMIGGKWKMRILWNLAQQTLRYGELRRAIGGITDKMLYQQLRQLEDDGLVHRTAYPEVPPRVEYSLTNRAETLLPILDRMADWAVTHLDDRLAEVPNTKASA